jgi:hypothetical protein
MNKDKQQILLDAIVRNIEVLTENEARNQEIIKELFAAIERKGVQISSITEILDTLTNTVTKLVKP